MNNTLKNNKKIMKIDKNDIEGNEEDLNQVFANQRKKISDDLLYFKNDLLKDFKEIEGKLSNKYEKQNQYVTTKIEKFENTINAMNQKILELSKLITTEKAIYDKIEKLNKFKSKAEDTLLSQETLISSISKELRDSINKYDKILTESVLYSGIIGPNSKFSTFHELIDFIITSITQFNTFKEKNILDFKGYKTKLESLIQTFKIQVESVISNTGEYTRKCISDFEIRVNDGFKTYDDKLHEIRMENNQYGVEIEKKLDNMLKSYNKINEIKTEIDNRFNEELYKLNEHNKETTIKFEDYKKEFRLIKDRFTTLSEFIKDMRFRVNMGQMIKKYDIKNITDKIDFTKKQKIIYRKSLKDIQEGKSILKQYIAGEVNLKELVQGKRKSKKLKRCNTLSFDKYARRMTFDPYQFSQNKHYENYDLFGNLVDLSLDDNKLKKCYNLEELDYKKSFNNFSFRKMSELYDPFKSYKIEEENEYQCSEKSSEENSEYMKKLNPKKCNITNSDEKKTSYKVYNIKEKLLGPIGKEEIEQKEKKEENKIKLNKVKPEEKINMSKSSSCDMINKSKIHIIANSKINGLYGNLDNNSTKNLNVIQKENNIINNNKKKIDNNINNNIINDEGSLIKYNFNKEKDDSKEILFIKDNTLLPKIKDKGSNLNNINEINKNINLSPQSKYKKECISKKVLNNINEIPSSKQKNNNSNQLIKVQQLNSFRAIKLDPSLRSQNKPSNKVCIVEVNFGEGNSAILSERKKTLEFYVNKAKESEKKGFTGRGTYSAFNSQSKKSPKIIRRSIDGENMSNSHLQQNSELSFGLPNNYYYNMMINEDNQNFNNFNYNKLKNFSGKLKK